MSSQISVEELIESYQKELGTLIHNKIMCAIQIEKLTNQVKELEEQNAQLKSSLLNTDK